MGKSKYPMLLRNCIFEDSNVVMICSIFLYLDPGSGSLLLQAAIALITGAAFYIALTRQKIRRFFSKLFHKRHPDAS
jgi:hypothetical protein